MVVKTRAKGHKYIIVSKRKVKTITAMNIQEAGVQAKRLFPKSGLITVRREMTSGGREFETYIISR